MLIPCSSPPCPAQEQSGCCGPLSRLAALILPPLALQAQQMLGLSSPQGHLGCWRKAVWALLRSRWVQKWRLPWPLDPHPFINGSLRCLRYVLHALKLNIKVMWSLVVEYCVQLWSPQHRTELELLERGQRRPQQWSEGWNPSAGRTGWESWGCSAWGREGCGETLEQLPVLKGGL